MNKIAKQFVLVLAGALALGIGANTAVAQVGEGYWGSSGMYVKNATGLCWHAGYWTPAMATLECDPDLVPKKPAPAPAPRVAPPPPPPKPAPKPAPAAAPKRCDATVTLQNDQLFAFNKAEVNAAAKARLDKDVVGRLPGCTTLEAIVIEGHTDRLGSHQYNQKLSERRADNVKKYLVSKGVATGKIETIGMGKTVPAIFCRDTKSRKELIACLAPSRRAIVSIKGPAK